VTQENEHADEHVAPDVVPESAGIKLPQPKEPQGDTAPAPTFKESFLTNYLKKAGKAMIVFAVIGCCFLMFAAWLLISTINQITAAVAK